MSNFYHMAKHIGSESLQSRLQSVDCSFVETVRELLDATQVCCPCECVGPVPLNVDVDTGLEFGLFLAFPVL